MTTLAVTIGELTPLPYFHLLPHRLEVPLHPVDADRDAVEVKSKREGASSWDFSPVRTSQQ